jgi:hypothetical protein
MALTRVEVQSLAVEPIKGHILEVADVRDTNLGFIKEDDLVEVALNYGISVQVMGGTLCAPVGTKAFDTSPWWTDGFIVTTQAGYKCMVVGVDDVEAKMSTAFDFWEPWMLEQAIVETWGPTAVDHTGDFKSGATPALAPKVAVAALEATAATFGMAVPNLLLPRSVLSLVSEGMVERVGTHFETKLGSRVAASGATDANKDGPSALADPAHRWSFALPPLLTLRGEKNVRMEMDRSTNEVYVLAERTYIVGRQGMLPRAVRTILEA